MVLYFFNSFLLSTLEDINLLFLSITLKALTYPLALGNTRTNCLITLSKY